MDDWKEVSRGEIMKLDEDNPVVEGLFTGIREGQYGPLFDLTMPDGSQITLPSDTVLQGILTKDLVGKTIKVQFTGLVASSRRKGKEYKNYKVFIKE